MAAIIGGTSPNASTLDTNKKQTKSQQPFKNVEENVLKQYTNVTYLWTFAPLTAKDLESINQKGNLNDVTLKEIVIASAGRFEQNRASTFYGTPEYYIDNVDIFTLSTPTRISGLSGNTTVNFDVFEPYSIGLFLQSCQVAAYRSGYSTYIEAAWILRLEFYGYNPRNNNKQEKIQGATREYPLKLQQISFTANEGGAKYQVKCIDFNLEGFNNVFGTYPGTANLTASTVEEALTKLQKVLNDDQKAATDKGVIRIPDEYKIIIKDDLDEFPKAKGRMKPAKFAAADSQASTPGKNKDTKKNETDNRANQPQPGARTFQWGKTESSRRITDMISEILKTSEYCTTALDEKNIDKDTGFVTWYRVSVNTEFKGGKYQLDPVTNRPAYTITYYVTPYNVHHSVFKGPSSPTLGINTLKGLVKKQYNYLYTGLNDDVLKWELKFDNTFYTAIASQGFTGRAEIEKNGSTTKEELSRRTDPGVNAVGMYLETGAGRLLRSSESYRKPMGGGTKDNAEILVARAFEEAMLLDTENIMLDLGVLGDPYYLTKSGVFIDRVLPNQAAGQINSDSTMATEWGEVRIYVRFRSPLDAPVLPKTLFEFPAAGTIDSPYSGLYRIRSVKSKFNDGLFTQELNLFRDRGQQSEELKNLRSDPNIIIGAAPGPDPNQGNAVPASPEVGTTTSIITPIVGTPLPPETKAVTTSTIEEKPIDPQPTGYNARDDRLLRPR